MADLWVPLNVLFKCLKRFSVKYFLQSNIILMGSPGSGKTTVGRILGEMLAKPVLDVDNDHLERFWGMPVSKKVSLLSSKSLNATSVVCRCCMIYHNL